MKMCDEDIKIARPKGSKIGIDTKSVPDVQEEYDRENGCAARSAHDLCRNGRA